MSRRALVFYAFAPSSGDGHQNQDECRERHDEGRDCTNAIDFLAGHKCLQIPPMVREAYKNVTAKTQTESLTCGTSSGLPRSHAGSYDSGPPPRCAAFGSAARFGGRGSERKNNHYPPIVRFKQILL